MRFALVMLAATVVVVSDVAAAPKRFPVCPPGRYVVNAASQPLIFGDLATKTDAVEVGGTTISIPSCGTARSKPRGTRGGTRLSARWKRCDTLRNVSFTGTIDTACKTLQGVFKAKRQRAQRFPARLSAGCGDGLVDRGLGEDCEGGGCPQGTRCNSACACETVPPSVTTTTITAPPSTATTATTTTVVPTTTTTTTTLVLACGNGVRQAAEECDGPDDDLCPGACENATCTCPQPVCGDGMREIGEECDDGDTNGGDGCGPTCLLCGNGITDDGEQCDDGNVVGGDGCGPTCQTACGNNVLDEGEQCDDGNTTGGDGCGPTCRACGDGVVALPEQCDDGNTAGNDLCGPTCFACGNGVIDGAEECDDGNARNADGCDSNCRPTGCGNGVQTVGESCDDGNTSNNDSCPADCLVDACAPVGGSSQMFTVSFAVSGGVGVASISVLLDYPEGKISIPGSGPAAQNRITVVPTSTSASTNDLDHALREVVTKTTPFTTIAPGQLFRVDFETCQGAPGAVAGDFNCTVLGASNQFGVDVTANVTCSVGP
jgi:cysteine-rich repeat protein